MMTTLALIAATAGKAARGDEVAPPKPMEGGVAVELVDPAKLDLKPEGIERIKIGKDDALRITGDASDATHRIAEIDKPVTSGKRYLVKGWIRYDHVEGDGFVEMWNHFGDQAFFSRTLGESGPMGKVTGTSGWRVFILPFNPEEGMKPDRLEVNLVLPGKGTATITDVRLVDFSAADQKAGAAAPILTTPSASGISSMTPIVVTSLCALLIVIGLAMLFVIAQRSRTRRTLVAGELRRMQAMDSI